MHSPRAQADKKAYQQHIKLQVEQQDNLQLRQETVADLITEAASDGPRVIGVSVEGGAEYRAAAVVLTTGTFLKAIMHTGEAKTAGGRAGEGTTAGISGALQRLGFEIDRFKTGTPPRLNARSIDYAKVEEQPGDDGPQPFSFLTQSLDDRSDALSHHLYQPGGSRSDSRQLASSTDVQRADQLARSSLLSID